MTKRISKEQHLTILAIADRAQRLFWNAGVERDRMDCILDIEAAHTDVGLRLDDLLQADEANFAHDIGGIARHLNRDTGKLENCFLPRYAA